MLVDRVGLVDPEQLLGGGRQRADRQRGVDDEERLVEARGEVGVGLQDEAEAAVAAHARGLRRARPARGAGRSGRRTRRARGRARRPRPAAGHAGAVMPGPRDACATGLEHRTAAPTVRCARRGRSSIERQQLAVRAERRRGQDPRARRAHPRAVVRAAKQRHRQRAGGRRGRGRPSSATSSSGRWPPAMTTASGASDATTSDRPETPPTGSAMTRAPERPQNSSNARTASASGSSSLRVASPTRIASRRTGGGREALRAAQPAVGPARGERPGRAVGAVALAELLERGQQHLLDRALDGAQRERGLHRAVGAVELEAGERADERVRVGAERLARAADRRRDRQPLLEGVAQRGDLPVRVQAVACRRTAGAWGSRSGAPTREACSG